MTYPLADPWVHGEDVDETKMFARTTDQINALQDLGTIGDTGWTIATLGNSWVTYGTPYPAPQYRLKNGVVFLKGAMKSGTTSTVAFTLPAGLRPAESRLFVGISNNFTAQITIGSSGNVIVTAYATGGSNAIVSLDNIQFVGE